MQPAIRIKTNRKSVDLVVQYINRAGELSAVPVRVNLAWCKAHGMDAEQAALYHVRAKVLDWSSWPDTQPLREAA